MLFLPDMSCCILLLGTSYFLAISAWDLLFTTQSPTAMSNNVALSPMLFHMLWICSSSVVLETFGLCSSETSEVDGCMEYFCPYIDDTFSSIVTLTMGRIGIFARLSSQLMFLHMWDLFNQASQSFPQSACNARQD